MKKLLISLSFFLVLFGNSQKLELNLISTQSGVDGCINDVIIEYEILNAGGNYELQVGYRNPNTTTNIVLSGSQVTVGIHQISVSITRDAFISICNTNGNCSSSTAPRNTQIRVDRCETRGYVLNKHFGGTNSNPDPIYEVMIDTPDPSKEYWVYEYVPSQNSSLPSNALISRLNIPLNVPGITQLSNISPNTTKLILREVTPNHPHVINPLSSLKILSVQLPARITVLAYGNPNNGVFDSNGVLISSNLSFLIPINEYNPLSDYYMITDDSIGQNIVTQLNLIQTIDYFRQILFNVSITENNMIVEFQERTNRGNVSHVRIRVKTIPDIDDDGVYDNSDNCPNVANANQSDVDTDTVGDVCDNCPNFPNTNQLDSDSDDVGDDCDNCPSISNEDQSDIDNDGLGDLCDDDIDGDGILNDVDNCPEVFNPSQQDTNSNGIGDDCETILPDLTFQPSNVIIFSDCSSCPAQLSSLGSNKHILTPTGNLVINVALIDNVSITASDPFKIKYYAELTSNAGVQEYPLPQGSALPPYVTNMPSISGNSSYNLSFAISGNDFGALTFSDSYKLVIKIDADNEVAETNESNNKISIPLKWKSSSTGDRPVNLNFGNNLIIPVDLPVNGSPSPIPSPINPSFNGLTLSDNSLNTQITPSLPVYNLKLYNFGSFLTTPVINVSVSEGDIVNCSSLPDGFYAVHINDSLVKSFAVNRL